MNKRISIMIPTRDRAGEVSMLLRDLNFQTYKDFDVIIIDDLSNVPLTNFYMFNQEVNELKMNGHKVIMERNDKFARGLAKNRDRMIEINKELGNNLLLFIDDDTSFSVNYLEELVKGIDAGYDLVTGSIIIRGQPAVTIPMDLTNGIANEVILDDEGNILQNGDTSFNLFYEDCIIPTHHFRTCALIKRKACEEIEWEKGIKFFRIEEFFSFKMILKGYKLGFNTKAIAYDLKTPSGGNRVDPNAYATNIGIDEEIFKGWVKEMVKQNGNFILKYNNKMKEEGLWKLE